MVLGRKETDDGSFHDEEIAFYKGLSLVDYQRELKETRDRVERLVTLFKYLEWLRSTQTVRKVHGWCEDLLQLHPFYIKALKLKHQELPWLFDQRLYGMFIRHFPSRVKQHSMLFMKARKFRALSSKFEVQS